MGRNDISYLLFHILLLAYPRRTGSGFPFQSLTQIFYSQHALLIPLIKKHTHLKSFKYPILERRRLRQSQFLYSSNGSYLASIFFIEAFSFGEYFAIQNSFDNKDAAGSF